MCVTFPYTLHTNTFYLVNHYSNFIETHLWIGMYDEAVCVVAPAVGGVKLLRKKFSTPVRVRRVIVFR